MPSVFDESIVITEINKILAPHNFIIIPNNFKGYSIFTIRVPIDMVYYDIKFDHLERIIKDLLT